MLKSLLAASLCLVPTAMAETNADTGRVFCTCDYDVVTDMVDLNLHRVIYDDDVLTTLADYTPDNANDLSTQCSSDAFKKDGQWYLSCHGG